MKAFFMLPETKSELEKMTFEQKSLLWARYSPYPYRRQTRALWYYIQCERAHTTIAAKHMTMLRKYMNNPDECIARMHKNKYNLNPGATITKTFRGLDYMARRRLVQTLIRRAIYVPGRITFFINTDTDSLRSFMRPDYINTQNNKIDFMRNGDDLILARPVVLNKWTGSNKYNAGRGGLMTRTDNHNMIVRAFATAWRYRMTYEKHGDLEYVVKSEQTSWRSLYRYLNLAYMHPEKVNTILSGKEVCSMEEIFAIAPQHQI